MKIGIIFDDSKYSNLDFSCPYEGNPGIGGTEYCFTMLIFYYAKVKKEDTVYVLHRNDSNQFGKDVKRIIYNPFEWNVLLNNKFDVVVFRAGFHRNDGLLEFAEKNQIKLIAWAHNYLTYRAANELVKNNSVKRVVFVSRQMYEHYIDHKIIEKSLYIFNMVAKVQTEDIRTTEDFDKVITYTGGLFYAKGFHILAKEWKKIVKKVPDAQLYVIGTGNLYDPSVSLGMLGVADVEYEKKFAKYLKDKNGHLLESVHFLGKMGAEKKLIYKKTAVGVMNPTGRTETFGLSAVEMEMAGVPIVVYRKASYPDVISDKKGGYLCTSRKEYRRRIIELINSPEKNYEMGCNARKMAEGLFAPEKVVLDWIKTVDDTVKEIPVVYQPPSAYFTNDIKILRIINRKLQMVFKIIPSLIWIDDFEAYLLDWLAIQENRMKKIKQYMKIR